MRCWNTQGPTGIDQVDVADMVNLCYRAGTLVLCAAPIPLKVSPGRMVYEIHPEALAAEAEVDIKRWLPPPTTPSITIASNPTTTF